MDAMRQLVGNIMAQAIDPFLMFLFALAVAVFIWGLIEFIIGADNEEARAKGKQHLIWGTVGLFIMFAVWGIVAIISNFMSSFG